MVRLYWPRNSTFRTKIGGDDVRYIGAGHYDVPEDRVSSFKERGWTDPVDEPTQTTGMPERRGGKTGGPAGEPTLPAAGDDVEINAERSMADAGGTEVGPGGQPKAPPTDEPVVTEQATEEPTVESESADAADAAEADTPDEETTGGPVQSPADADIADAPFDPNDYTNDEVSEILSDGAEDYGTAAFRAIYAAERADRDRVGSKTSILDAAQQAGVDVPEAADDTEVEWPRDRGN